MDTTWYRPVALWKTLASPALLGALLLPAGTPPAAAAPAATRLTLAADSGWRFALGDPSGAEARDFADGAWRAVDLPHDWSIEGVPDKNNPTGGGGGFFPAGTGWYRRTFRAPAEWKGRRVGVEFDGVYRDATVYLNGHKLGTHPYGYTSFAMDMTPELDFAGSNVLAVRVDNSAQPNSRWYSGSGIYRHVRVVVTDPTHVAHWGVYVTTPEATESGAKVALRTRVQNEGTEPAAVTVETTLLDARGKQAGRAESTISLPAGAESEASQTVAMARPALWSPETPVLYRAVTRVRKNGRVVDEVVTPFGVRSLTWSAEKGLLLNGKSIKLTGGSVHHDNGPLGAAAFDRAEERRVELLKAAGHNAVRTAHNPPSPAFLDACDRLGLLVLDEPFDTWEASKVKFDYSRDFDAWSERDVAAMVLRDRNHPSVVMWGIGNEIPEVFTDRGGPIAKRLATEVRSLDATRPVTQAMPGTTSGPTQKAVFSALDIGGYNYNLAKNYARDHREQPERLMLTTESFPAEAFTEWELAKENPFIVGEFVWTAMDYLGESGIGAPGLGTPEQAALGEKVAVAMSGGIDQYFIALANGVDPMASMAKSADPGLLSVFAFLVPGYPWHGSDCGDLDLTGERKPQSFYRDILWHGGDRVYATVRSPAPEGKKVVAIGWAVTPTIPSWSWPEQEGRTMEVEVYSGAEKVRLYLNDKLIGEQPTGREQQFRALFEVPYAPGTLKAMGVRGDRAVAESVLTTAGRAVTLRLRADRTMLGADGQDLSFVTVEAVDAQGRPQPNAQAEVQFAVSGPGVLAAVGNADGQDPASYHGDRRKLYQGRALAVVRTMKQAGAVHVTATAAGLSGGAVDLQTKTVDARAELR